MKSSISRLLLSSLTAGIVLSLQAVAQPGLVSQRTVAPGVLHKEFTLPGPYTLDVLEVALANPFITLESYRSNGLTKTTVQAAANDRAGHRVIGAVNADFFSFETGWPVGNQVVNGVVALGVSSSRSHLAVDSGKKPFIERLAFTGRVWSAGGASSAVSQVNTDRAAGAMVFYTPFRGATTGTDAAGAECAVEFLDPPRAGDTLMARVIATSPGNMSIPSAGGILSAAPGTPATFVTNMQVGDTIRLFLGFNRPLHSIVQALGGAGRFLSGGRNVTDSMSALEGITTSFTGARHPRTFVGINADTSVLYVCTVDGRQASSIGMTFAEMAGFMMSIGASDAFNFDGGGSTTMVVRGEIVNSPSDPAGERSVANSLQVINNAPPGALHFLSLLPKRADLFQSGTQQFTATGDDEYYNLITLPADAMWEADPSIGTITPAGLFTAAKTNDSGWVRLRWHGVADSARVVVHLLNFISVLPSSLVMVPGERVSLLVRAEDSGGRKVTLENSQLAFSSPASVINVDALGLVTARDFGSGTVQVSLDTLHATVPFNFSGNDTSIIVEPMQTLFTWDTALVNLTGSGVQVALTSDPVVTTPPALRIAYAIPDVRGELRLNCNISLSGRIDSLFIHANGSGNSDTIRFLVRDKDGDLFLLTAGGPVTWANEWRTSGVMMSKAVPVGTSSLDYPVSIVQVRIDFGRASLSGGIVYGTLLLDDLGAHYPLRTVAPQVLFDFETGITGWYTPLQANAAQEIGIDRNASTLVASTERAYQGNFSGKWTFVDDVASSADWDVRITRNTTGDLGNMLRGSYIGAWVYADGETSAELQTVVRGGNGQICAGPRFPVRHVGWKLIGTRLDEGLFSPYLTSGVITDAGNKFNGFRLRGPNGVLQGQTRVIYIDRLVTSPLTVPTGFTGFTVSWSAPLARLRWSVNSEISINRYAVERGSAGAFAEIGSMQGGGNVDTTVEYEYVDTPPPGASVQYRIRQITNDGGQETTQPISVNTGANSVGPEGALPERYELLQNYPNPFNPATTISYALPRDSQVTLTLFNTLGQRVGELVNTVQPAGFYHIPWRPILASGVYFYRLEAVAAAQPGERFSDTRSLVLIR